MAGHPLDNAAWGSLGGAHRDLAERLGGAARYPEDIAPFAAVPDQPSAGDWSDLAELAGPGGDIVLFRPSGAPPPPGWTTRWSGVGVQLVATRLSVAADPEVETLGVEHAGEMIDLVERTRPGPFRPRTPLLGLYLGLRDPDGALIAMAGERLRPEGHSEISAVCTAEEHRGKGLASRLVRSVAAEIVGRGDIPFLHAASTNVGAIRLYLAMGFTHRCDVNFASLIAPASSQSPR